MVALYRFYFPCVKLVLLWGYIMPNASSAWLDLARRYIGVAEIHGPHHNPKVVELWLDAGIKGVSDDETPWCAAFVCAVLELSGIKSPRSGWARNFTVWASKLTAPAVGCIVVFSRGATSGHVGFVVGKDENDNLMVLGGNQSDKVCIEPFTTDRVLGYRWPAPQYPLPDDVGFDSLPVVTSDGKVSTDES